MKYYKYVLFTLISVVIIDSFRYISIVGALNVDNATSISTLLNYISIAILISIAYKESFGNNEIPKSIQNLIILWLFWNIFNLIRGAFLSVDYWDWKGLLLSGVSFSFIPMTFFLGKDPSIAKIIFKFIINYLFLFGFLLIPLTFATNEELYSRLMIPISLFILFIPYLKTKWKFLIVTVAIISILMVIDFRSNVIKIAFSFILLTIYYFHDFIGQKWLRLTHLSLFCIPLILFTLAFTDHYNIFNEMSKQEGLNTLNSQGEEESLTDDTRTFLYSEVLSSFYQSEDLVIGKSAIGSYQSEWFDGDDGGAMNGKRTGCEVGILNILLHYGLIGVIIYFLLLINVSYIAINHSNNILSKMLGLYIAFRWTYSFVEEFTQYDLNFYFFWIAVGLVSSTGFRKLNDMELQNYFELR